MHEALGEVWQWHQNTLEQTLELVHEHLELRVRSRGRTILEQFHHMVKTRRQWMEHIKPRQEIGDVGRKRLQDIQEGLAITGEGVGNLIRYESEGEKVSGVRGSVLRLVSYLVSHESHHRGQILQQVKNAGIKIEREKLYEMWKW